MDPIFSFRNPSLQLRTITTRQILSSAAELAPLTVADCLSLAHPQTPLGLVGCVAVWLTGNVLAIFEGTLDHPDPSRLKQIIKKFELKSAILPKCDLDPEYMAMVPVPSLTRIITEVGNSGEIARSFSDVDILEWDVEAALRGHE
ncbi:unnamed protein product [Heligmosomoides polygyrus]|uniref:AMP-binding_C domain-containing protein n=1 Tax=Heligmosomoides polygyrus TaxID=6339 RepID=A0A183FG05_HELPZ|nr:unnamed protein product [Heligmosomoides polygyrus]